MKLYRTTFVSFLAYVGVLLLSGTVLLAEEAPLSGTLPEYSAPPRQSSTLTAVGSDSMGGLVRMWVQEYRKLQPKVKLQVVARGSAMAPAALIEGTADFGPMARPMRSDELEGFVSKYGFEPTQIRTSIAAASVYVHSDNPLRTISFDSMERIYSAEPSRSDAAGISRWSELGVKGSLASQEIITIGGEKESTVRGYFQQRVLLQKPFVAEMMTTASLSSLFKVISMNPAAIGFGPVASAVPSGVRVLKISKSLGGKAYLPTADTMVDGKYPLSRYLNIYVVQTPGEKLEASLRDFLRFVLSRQGQKLVVSEGLTPLPPEVLAEELAKL